MHRPLHLMHGLVGGKSGKTDWPAVVVGTEESSNWAYAWVGSRVAVVVGYPCLQTA